MGPGLAALHADRDELQRGPLAGAAAPGPRDRGAHEAPDDSPPERERRRRERRPCRATPSRRARSPRSGTTRVAPHAARPHSPANTTPAERASDEALAHRLGRRRPRRVRRARRRAPGSAGTARTTRGTRRWSRPHPRRRPGTTPPRSSFARRTDPTPRQHRRRPTAPRSRPWIWRGSSPTGSATAPHAGSPWRPRCRRSDRRTARRRRAAPRTTAASAQEPDERQHEPPPERGGAASRRRDAPRGPRPTTPRAARARRRAPPMAPADPATASGSANASHNTGCSRSMPNCGKPSVIGNAATNIGSAKPSPTAEPASADAAGVASEPTRLFAPGAEREHEHRDRQGAHRDLQGRHRRHPVGRLGRRERHAHARQASRRARS